ncbi:hypothetical protein PVK06_027843 [Gossypium arboreum]|uniref:Uncharacterized protein n=1 Tax=Gossypium arboreum TaxID=29729 RepID=A0ABR0P1C3_GOSAR|nr:hypothetical protein PVK06_027843 [Gossypium arboreum]
MEEEHANLNLDDEEEELIPCEKDPNELEDDYQFCLVHNLLFGVISEGLAWKLGNFIRQFIQHDAALVMRREQRMMGEKKEVGLIKVCGNWVRGRL